MAYFDRVKVGDVVYGGEGDKLTVSHVTEESPQWFRVNGDATQFNEEGRIACRNELGRILFWQPPPKFDPPPRPKRKVKKEGWINVYKNADGSYQAYCIFNTKEEAKTQKPIAKLIDTVLIPWEAELMEARHLLHDVLHYKIPGRLREKIFKTLGIQNELDLQPPT